MGRCMARRAHGPRSGRESAHAEKSGHRHVNHRAVEWPSAHANPPCSRRAVYVGRGRRSNGRGHGTRDKGQGTGDRGQEIGEGWRGWPGAGPKPPLISQFSIRDHGCPKHFQHALKYLAFRRVARGRSPRRGSAAPPRRSSGARPGSCFCLPWRGQPSERGNLPVSPHPFDRRPLFAFRCKRKAAHRRPRGGPSPGRKGLRVQPSGREEHPAGGRAGRHRNPRAGGGPSEAGGRHALNLTRGCVASIPSDGAPGRSAPAGTRLRASARSV